MPQPTAPAMPWRDHHQRPPHQIRIAPDHLMPVIRAAYQRAYTCTAASLTVSELTKLIPFVQPAPLQWDHHPWAAWAFVLATAPGISTPQYHWCYAAAEPFPNAEGFQLPPNTHAVVDGIAYLAVGIDYRLIKFPRRLFQD